MKLPCPIRKLSYYLVEKLLVILGGLQEWLGMDSKLRTAITTHRKKYTTHEYIKIQATYSRDFV